MVDDPETNAKENCALQKNEVIIKMHADFIIVTVFTFKSLSRCCDSHPEVLLAAPRHVRRDR